MHVLHLILIDVDSETFTKNHVHDIIETNISDTVESWFDYYEVGGRWSDYFEELATEHSETLNTPATYMLPYKGNESLFLKALNVASRSQNRAFMEARDRLSGGVVALADHSEGVFGIQTTTSSEESERLTKFNKKISKEWQQVLKSESLEQLRTESPFNMGIYYAKQLTKIVDGQWFSDSFYYDFLDYSTDPSIVRKVLTAQTDKERPTLSEIYDNKNLVLVAVDFHY